MSIPKEPRQLMINLMYLVLTAMLALNVSAEIFQAFNLINKELEKSNMALENQNDIIPDKVKQLSKKDPARLGVYAERTTPAQFYADVVCDSIDAIVNYMIDKSGNNNQLVDDGDYHIKLDDYDKEISRELKGKKNKDITTRLLVGAEPSRNEAKGWELEELIVTYREKYFELIDEEDRASFENRITLRIDSSWAETSDKLNWAHYNFYQMPLAATLPIFNKLKNDARATEAAVLNYLLEKCGGTKKEFTNFRVVASPRRNYVIRGEKYEAELFLAAYNKAVNGLSISVDGKPLRVNNGVATYTTNANRLGVHKYNAKMSILNPVTGEVTTETGEFEFEVGERSCNVAAEKMNVFYIGVENPVSVTAAGIASYELKVEGEGVKLTKSSNGKYIAIPDKVGKGRIVVSGGGLERTEFPFRIKRIPDPVPVIGAGKNKKGGTMGSGEFKAQKGLAAILEHFDFEATCRVIGYRVARLSRGNDPLEHQNEGARYDGRSKRIVEKASPGDIYYFDEIKAKCPGDKVSRQLPSIGFKIR